MSVDLAKHARFFPHSYIDGKRRCPMAHWTARRHVTNMNWHHVRGSVYVQAVGLCGCHSVETWRFCITHWVRSYP